MILKINTNPQFTVSSQHYATAALAYEQILNNILAQKENILSITTSVAQELISIIDLESIGQHLGITTTIELG